MNGQVHVGKENKQVKQHSNPRNYANEGLQYHVIIRSANLQAHTSCVLSC